MAAKKKTHRLHPGSYMLRVEVNTRGIIESVGVRDVRLYALAPEHSADSVERAELFFQSRLYPPTEKESVVVNQRTSLGSSHRFSCQSTDVVPPIVCLCGSTKFPHDFMKANMNETMRGKIVLSVGFFMHSPQLYGEDVVGHVIPKEQKALLDQLHLRKIDLADEVLILNVCTTEHPHGYIGKSTKREAWYALHCGKAVRFLNPLHGPLPLQGTMSPNEVNAYVEKFFANWAEWEAAAEEAADMTPQAA